MVGIMYFALHRSAMSKSEVYSWRVSPELKERLEDAARVEDMSMAGLIEQIAVEWLEDHAHVDEVEQRRLHHAARACMGTINGMDPYRAENAKKLVREIIRQKHARKRTH